jgi:hypothetical protein
MCFKPTQSEEEALRAKRNERQAHRPGRPGSTRRPRGNGEMDRRDFERGVEKLTALVGR